MIFFFNAQGALIKSVPTDVYQGSNKASRIWVLMPTASTNIVNVAFTLPNGKYAPQRLMTNATLGTGIVNGDKKFVDELGQPINAWYYDIKTDVTSYAGNITAQFFVTTPSDDKSDSEIITTQSVNIIVLKGTPLANIPAPIDEYQEIIKVLASINATVVNIKKDVDNFKNETVENLEEQFDELEADLNNKFNELEENSTASQVIQNTNNIKALFNLQLNKNVLAYDNAEFTEEIQQTGGVDLENLTILDGSYATVNKISGDTVRCENLINLDAMVATGQGGNDNALVKNADGSFTITKNGNNRFSKSWKRLVPAGYISVSAKIIGRSENMSNPAVRFSDDAGNTVQTAGLFESGTLVKLGRDATTIQVYYGTSDPDGYVTFKDLMVNIGSSKPYQPYFTGLKHAQISGIKSIGRNYIDTDAMVGDALVKNTDGSFTITKNGNNRFSKSWKRLVPAGYISVSAKIIGRSENMPNPAVRFSDDAGNTVQTAGIFENGTLVKLGRDATTIQVYYGTSDPDGYVTFKDLMVNVGSASPYEPYTESVVELPENLMLKKWEHFQDDKLYSQASLLTITPAQISSYFDYIGQNESGSHLFAYYITAMADDADTVVCDKFPTITYNELQTAPAGFCALSGKAVYFTTNYASVLEFANSIDEFNLLYKINTLVGMPKNYGRIEYLVDDKGTEQVITPTDEKGLTSFDYGAKTKEENSYYVIVGGNEQ